MAKMWAGRSEKETAPIADDFNTSIHFDCRMYRQDIMGSMAHAAMLGHCGILTPTEAAALQDGLAGILSDLDEGTLTIDPAAEDIHMFVEQTLTERLGDVGRKLHTARSRNDQVALDLRLYLLDEVREIRTLTLGLLAAITDQAERYKATVMPGYTHLQRAQPITFGHHLMAYAMMLQRDIGRLDDAAARMNVSPIGCCALAGTSFPIDRVWEASQLGFPAVTSNSIDGVSDRDFCVEFLSACAVLMMHLSRLSEEIVLWSSWEFHFIELDDAYTTGSSIMPQKKNPDMAELCRGKTGRVYGELIALLTTLKGLPLAYNKDMQENKEAVFDCVDTVKMCLRVFTPMIAAMKACTCNMYRAAQRGFLNATDLADYLTKKGLPFRAAYKIAGQLVAYCIEHTAVLEELPLALLVSIPLRILGVRLLNRPHQPEAGRLPAIYFSKNRPECWGGYLFVWVELLVWMVCRGDAESLLISTLAALGGGMGWFLGNLMQLWSHRPFKSGRLFLGRWNRAGVVNGWKIMECTIGEWGGCLGLFGFWLSYRRKTDAVVQTFEPWMQNQTLADVLTLVWLALLLAYSVCSIRLQAQPPYRPELDRLKKLGLISAESYAKKNAAATDQKPDGVSGLILSHGDACDRLVYATIPLLLMLSGSALAAQLTAGFVIVWVLMERMLFGRFEDFRHLTAIRIVFLSLSAVLLAAQLCLYPAGGLKPAVLLAIDTAFYTLLVLMNDFRPKNIRAMRAEHSGWIRFFGAKLTTDLYFICCTAVTLIWYAAAC